MAEESKKEEAAVAAVSAPASGGGSSKLGLILSLVNTVVTLAMVAILFISFQREKKAASVDDISVNESPKGGESKGEGEKGEGEKGEGGEKAKPKKTLDFGKMVTLDKFTVNLSTPGSVNPKFAVVSISIEVPTDDIETEINSKMPQVRNTIIDLFNSKRASDLATAEGRDYLKDEIKNSLNSFMTTGKVKGVFFTNFALSS